MKKNLGRAGFTLIELLVVVAIIALAHRHFASVFGAARRLAKNTACM